MKYSNQPSKKEFEIFEHLKNLIGEWDVEISSMSFLGDPAEKVRGQASIQWLDPGPFVVQHIEFQSSVFPSSTWLIGYDEIRAVYEALYSDSSNESRIYRMSVFKDTWELSRKLDKETQRFTGQLDPERNMIIGKWEKTANGSEWYHDFDMIYTRRSK